MAFPASVNQVIDTRKKPRRPKTPRKPEEGGIQDGIPPGVGVGGPILDFGREGGVTLVKGEEGYEWDWASQYDPKLKLSVAEEAILLFPGLKQVDPPSIELSYDEQLHATKSYLEDRLESDDNTGVRDLILEEYLGELHPSTSSFRPKHDIYDGTKLALIHNPRAKVAKTLICFATGPLGNQLNISPFLPPSNAQADARGVTRFVPTSQPIYAFPTPILQVCSSPVVSSNRLDRDATILAVRLQSSTYFFHVYPLPNYMPPTESSPIDVELIDIINTAETGSPRIVDLALDPTSFGRALVVDETGGVVLWIEKKVERAERLYNAVEIKQIRHPLTGVRESFFRIAWGTRSDTALVMSDRELLVLDLEGNGPAETLLELKGNDRVFTSMEKTSLERGVRFTVVCTTYEVIWLDEYQPGVPVMSWIPDLGAGRVRDLDVTYIGYNGNDCTMITSSTLSLAMILHIPYDLPIHSLHPPYFLSLPSQVAFPLTSAGYVKLQRNSLDRISPTILVGTSSDGALWAMPIKTTEDVESAEPMKKGKGYPRNKVSLKVKWSDAVQDMAVQAAPEGEGEGGIEDEDDSKIMAKHSVHDMRWAWLEIAKFDEADDGTSFDLRRFEKHLKESDAPFEHLMTTADLARDMLHGPPDNTRSSLLRPLQVNDNLARRVDMFDLPRFLPIISTYTQDDPDPVSHARLRGLDRPELDARHLSDYNRLVTDLALSRNVVNSDDIGLAQATQNTQRSEMESPEELFARATGQLSLADKEPPPIAFTYLMPRPTGDFDFESSPDPLQTLPARALLDEWSIGSDPREYTWNPWLGEKPPADGAANTRRPIKPLPGTRSPNRSRLMSPSQSYTQISTMAQPLRSTNSVPDLMRLPPVVARSSPPPEMGSLGGLRRSGSAIGQLGGLSQEMMVQTQVEPGKFGGRTAGGPGKKKVKKRVGGF